MWQLESSSTTNVSFVEEAKVYKTILHGIWVKIRERILVMTCDTMRTNDEATQGYYIVE